MVAQGVDKALSSNGNPYQVILMDIQMPGMDGRAATRELRARGVTTPIIALTAAAMQQNRDESFAAGCDDFLVKPIDMHRLLEVVQSWVAKKSESRIR